jgi:spore maturation protein CgeB
LKIVIFGLSMSSSWGNGHATLWRGLCRALASLGHECAFFERDVPYYAQARDCAAPPYADLRLYSDWASVRPAVDRALADADAAIVTSYCPDALAAELAIREADPPIAVFYDLDTPVTLALLEAGRAVPYIGAGGLSGYDLVLSYTGGGALDRLGALLGARRVAPLYGHVDTDTHRPVAALERYRCDLSYLGTFAGDRQDRLERLLIEPAARAPARKFMIAGAQYPADFPWRDNIHFVRHLPPAEHSAFFCSSRLTLNVTRRAMALLGWCPSARLFEAAACATPVLSDDWDGLSAFYTPDTQILIARDAHEALAALDLPDRDLRRIGAAARERTLDCHSSQHRARELIALLDAPEDGRLQAAGARTPASPWAATDSGPAQRRAGSSLVEG